MTTPPQPATLPLSEWHDRAEVLKVAFGNTMLQRGVATAYGGSDAKYNKLLEASVSASKALSAHLRTVPGPDALGVSPSGPGSALQPQAASASIRDARAQS